MTTHTDTTCDCLRAHAAGRMKIEDLCNAAVRSIHRGGTMMLDRMSRTEPGYGLFLKIADDAAIELLTRGEEL